MEYCIFHLNYEIGETYNQTAVISAESSKKAISILEKYLNIDIPEKNSELKILEILKINFKTDKKGFISR